MANKNEREFGRKYGIDFGFYRSYMRFLPAFAAKTGFTYYDLDNFLFSLKHMLDDDHCSGQHLRLVGLVDFQHQSALGNAPAHKLFDLVKVTGKTKDADGKRVFISSDSEFPHSLDDYESELPDFTVHEGDHLTCKVPQCNLHVTSSGEIKPGPNNHGVAVIKARKLVWEIPGKSPASSSL